ncbi:biotin/lipoate--protein ligase family protein [Nisaea acidiphila]|uniref:Biotin/lipoate--protein ligase family protein n=1 Tax=Nisaea acidiphila TaxID=1862145 RepID=A0A9J7AZ23_9PROT|nr:biotin/lipoate--protein ligase family protein [Nisaea acidiphila]UUX52034.1 biotin/lipoate--protein ligase family protein [Nisaea acidiphila]
MLDELSFPPIYRPCRVLEGSDPLEAAIAAAKDGADPASLFWLDSATDFACAIVLGPDRPLSETLAAVHVAMVALGDCLGATVPPQVEVLFGWPDRLIVNGALAGGVTISVDPALWDDPEDPEPEWAVLGIRLAMTPRDDAPEPGMTRQRTTLFDEGCGDLTTGSLLESFSRHFLLWTNRYLSEGLRPIADMWLPRAAKRGENVELKFGGKEWRGTLLGLDEKGGLVLGETKTPLVPLTDVVRKPTWSLD